jgi:PIN domain nuclease of toxin-antitoxin system
VAVSVISCFEIAQLVKHQRLILPLSVDITCRAVNLTDIHKDLFDRIIITTALDYQAKLISADSHFKNYSELNGCLLDC